MTGRTGQAEGGEGMLGAFTKGLTEGGDSGVVGLGKAEGRMGSWEEG